MKPRRYTLLGSLLVSAVLMLAVWMLLVWVSSRPALKVLIDLTPQRVNSVDPATEELLDELRAQKTAVEFHLFLPPIQGQAQDAATRQAIAIRRRLGELTRLLLRRYQWLGGEGVTIDEYDLYGDAARTRDAAQQFDYKAVEGEVLVVAVRPEGRERRYRKLSLVADLADIDLPAVQPSPGPLPRAQVPVLKDFHGELQISSTLKSLLVQGSPVACFLGGYSPALDLEGTSGGAYSGFRAGLRQAGFEVRDINLGSGPVPADAALVIVLEPRRDFTDRDAEALFDYVKRGGRLFLNYSWGGIVDEWNPTGGRLGELLGYDLSAAPVFHLIADVTGGRTRGPGIAGPGVEKLQLFGNPSHPVTRRFVQGGRPIEVAAARELRVRDGAPSGMRREELLLTGPNGWLGVAGGDGYPELTPPQGIRLRDFIVGLSIELDPDAGTATAPGAARPGQVIVISGVFCNNAGMPLFGDLAFNVCNWMAERKVLLDIHGARYEARTLTLQPQQLDRIWLFLFYGVPGTFFVLGGVVIFLRRRL